MNEGNPDVLSSLRVTWPLGGELALWDVGGGRSLAAPLAGKLDSYPVQIVFSPDGERFVTRSNGKRAGLWSAVTRQPSGGEINDQEAIESVAFSPLGDLATGSRDGRVILRDGETGVALGEPLPLNIPRALSLAFHPGGRRLAAGTEGGVAVWDFASEKVSAPVWDIPTLVRMDLVSDLSYSPDGTRLVAGYERYVYLWDGDTLEMLGAPLPGPFGESKVKRVAVSPDSRLLAVTYEGSRVVLWDLATRTMAAPPFELSWGAAFSPDNALFAVGHSDGSLTFWNLATFEPLGDPVQGHDGEVQVLAFSPHGRVLVSGAGNNSILFWQVDLESWLASACARAERNLSGTEWTRYLGDLPYDKTCPAYPVDASAIDLLLSQAGQATARGDGGMAQRLYGRASSYALELKTPLASQQVCQTASDRSFAESVRAGCEGESRFSEGAGDGAD